MLKNESNELICRVGPGTPAGYLFRSIWLPALLSCQLPYDISSSPVRLKLLGEELIAFRDGSGSVGITGRYCMHRGASLFFGKVEEDGIRCAYHGWKYRCDGQCVEMPSQKNSKLAERIKLKSYHVKELNGVIWVYMGEDAPPAFPEFPWATRSEPQSNVKVWLQETNWLQGLEGEIDSSHVSTLHKTANSSSSDRAHRRYTFIDPNPSFDVVENKAGFMAAARRLAEDKYYWRVTQWVLPMFSLIPGAYWPVTGRAWVPIDDYNTYTWGFGYVKEGELPSEYYEYIDNGLTFPPKCNYRKYQLNDGSTIDTYVPIQNKVNDYCINRELQNSGSTTGIFGFNSQDRAMQEGMGQLPNREQEHLVSGDKPIVLARKKLIELIEDKDKLEEFKTYIQDGKAFSMEPLDVVSDIDNIEGLLNEYYK